MPPLLKLLLIRFGLGLMTLFLVSIVVFAATQALPGDAAKAILGKDSADVERYEALRAQLRLDRPLVEQYTSWLGGVVRGDLGNSLVGAGRRAQAVNETDAAGDGSGEANAIVRPIHIIVHRLGDGDDTHALLV